MHLKCFLHSVISILHKVAKKKSDFNEIIVKHFVSAETIWQEPVATRQFPTSLPINQSKNKEEKQTAQLFPFPWNNHSAVTNSKVIGVKTSKAH